LDWRFCLSYVIPGLTVAFALYVIANGLLRHRGASG
jgi:hypothetical protein